jgi:two-component system, chemotaxis family, CheB/CheR fusion protein
MTFAELMGVDECVKRVKIYGTDVDEEALREARSGLYARRAVESLSAELTARYFEPSGAQLAFHPELRRRVIFGRHDITRDAPISRLDLLVCRNTLMYFNVEAQSQIVDRFHFRLASRWLSVPRQGRDAAVGQRPLRGRQHAQRVFKRRPGEAVALHQLAALRLDSETSGEMREASRKRQLRDMVLDTSASPVLAIGVDGTLGLINSQARAQFGLSVHDIGRPLRDLEISYRPFELRSLIEQAETERRLVRANNVERRLPGGETQIFDIIVQALTGARGLPVGVAVTFIDTTVTTRLHNEVRRVREDLETTNEELQSSIEELETMNEEMRIRTAEVDEARGFLEGVLSSVAAGGSGAGLGYAGTELEPRRRGSLGLAHRGGLPSGILLARLRPADRPAA